MTGTMSKGYDVNTALDALRQMLYDLEYDDETIPDEEGNGDDNGGDEENSDDNGGNGEGNDEPEPEEKDEEEGEGEDEPEEKSNPIFPEGTILIGEGNRPSLYQGIIGFLAIGDLKRVERGLHNHSRWGVHDAILMVVVSGETDKSKKKANEIARLVEIGIDENPTLSKIGLMVNLAKDTPIMRRPVTFERESKAPQWNTAIIIKMDIQIARIQT